MDLGLEVDEGMRGGSEDQAFGVALDRTTCALAS